MENKSTLFTTLALQFLFTGAIAIASHPEPNPAFKAAAEECAKENGVTLPAPGSQPTPEDREAFGKIRPCLEAKGFKAPPHHRHHREKQSPHDESGGGEG